MLSNIIESDTKALAKVFSNKEFYRSVDGSKKDYKAYLADIVSEDLRKVVLPKEIIPNQVTLNVFAFAYRKDSSILPILLKYFTYKNLLKEAKGDLDKINQKLQGVMDEELKKLQDEQKLLRKETSELSGKEVDVKQGKVLVTKSEKITEISSKVEKIKLCKENIKNLLNGDKVKLRFYPPQYFSILNSGLIEIIEKKLTAYVKDDTNIENIYQSLNNKAKKIIISGNIKIALQTSSLLVFLPVFTSFTLLLAQTCAGLSQLQRDMFYFFMHYSLPILLPTVATLLALASVVYLVQRYYEQSFVKEMQDFIKGPKRAEKAANTEDEKELESKVEPKISNLIDFSDHHEIRNPSAPPYENEQLEDPSGKLLAQSNGSIDPILHGGISCV